MMGALKQLDARLSVGRESNRRPIYWYLRNAGRVAVNQHRTRALAKCEVKPPIVMSFVRRSGSTWIAQMMARVPGVVTIGDPLLARNAWLHSKRRGFPLRDMYFDPTHIAETRPYLDESLGLKVRTSTLMGWRDHDLAAPIQPFMKIANTPWLLDWFAEEFEATTCLLVRHPIDIARSQLRHFNMPPHLDATLKTLEAMGALSAEQMKFAKRINDTGSPFQRRLVEIVLEYRPIWNAHAALTTISYSRLRDGDLDQFAPLNLPDPDWKDAMQSGMHTRSKTTQVENTLSGASPHSDDERADLDRTLDAFEAGGILERL